MIKNFIEIEGKEYRVEANFNAIGDALDILCKPLSAIQNFKTLNMNDIITLMWTSIVEGERLEGRDCQLSKKDLGSVITGDDLEKFIEVFVQQWNPEKSGESNEDNAKKKITWTSRP